MKPTRSVAQVMLKSNSLASRTPYGMVPSKVERTRTLDIMDQACEPSRNAAVSFDVNDVSPYNYPLDGEHYTPYPGVGLSGMCPICNNTEHAMLDHFYIKNLYTPAAWSAYPFDKQTVLTHVVSHIGPIYARVHEKHADMNQATVDYLTNSLQNDEKGRKISATMNRSFAITRRELRKEDDETEEYTIYRKPDEPVEDNATPSPCREYGVRAKHWYAYNLGENTGPLRLWGDKRVSTEVAKRSNEAIVFYEEMLDVRAMSRRIHDEIMDGEREPVYSKDGEVLGYKERNYQAALKAVSIIKDVAMDMTKLALIATKMGEGNQAQKLSPTMQGIMDDIGIFDKANPFQVEEAQVLEDKIDQELGEDSWLNYEAKGEEDDE